jgi:hypothetical protein
VTTSRPTAEVVAIHNKHLARTAHHLAPEVGVLIAE